MDKTIVPTEIQQELFDDILMERARQVAEWGCGGNTPFQWMSIIAEEKGELCRAVNETFFHHPKHPENGGYENIRREAVHTIATIIGFLESLEKGRDGILSHGDQRDYRYSNW